MNVTFPTKVSSRALMCAVAPMIGVGAAHAQIGETLLLPPVVPPGFDRGHNQSVIEMPRPAFTPVGINVGSFRFLPSIVSGVGATSNTYYTANPVSSAFLTNTPSAELISSWNRHELRISATGTFRDYIGQSRRNEATWQEDVRARIDIRRFSSFTIEEISSQLAENQFSGETTPTVAALSRYRRDFVSAEAVDQVGRARVTLSADHASFRFQPLRLLTGESVSQTNRNRVINRLTGQIEYAHSPSLAFFAQASFAGQSFETSIRPGVPNVDSESYRILAGFNFDDAGFARGSLGLGYTHQTFTAQIYRPVSGLSVQARLELFPSRLTTLTFEGSRTIEITNLGVGGGAYWNNRISARVDREIWRRIILNITGLASRQDYIITSAGAKSFQMSLGGQYFSSRRIVVNASVSYGARSSNSSVLGTDFKEARSEVGLTYRI